MTTNTEIIAPAQADIIDLRNLAENINNELNTIITHEGAFEEATLAHRLRIGQEISKAQGIFGLSKAEAGRLGGQSKKSIPTVGMLPDAHRPPNPFGFGTWLKKEIPLLPRNTADRYAQAFRGLGLPADAAPAALTARIKKLYHEADKTGRGRPTLKALHSAGRPPKQLPAPVELPAERPTLKLEDAREAAHLYQEAGAALVNAHHLDHLDRPGLEALKAHLLWMRDRVTARLKTI
jgi:hypothetical protein